MNDQVKGTTPPIAVVGVSALFPGASDVASFWRDVLSGRDNLTEVPRTHWLKGDYFDARPVTPDKVCTTRGGFLPSVDFAPLEFGMPPNVVQATDTSQLLALIVAKRALDEATRGRFESMDRKRMSVVLGVASATELVAHMSGRLQIPIVERAMRNAGLTETEVTQVGDLLRKSYVPWQENTFPGLLGNVVAGRIANRLDLGGTNSVVDAACASSLAAVDIGINELALGRADLVISGGVDTLNDILMYMCFAQTGALSPTGDCRPFSDDADGTMLGEGIGMVALKRLADAERDGDAIYAVIRGMGTSSDGRAKSIYAPAPEGQALALTRAYERAGYGPETVQLIEAHGTATKAGDAAEVAALKEVFGRTSASAASCALGSVKSQIGHTKAAAGSAGLIKAVLALHHKVLPGTYKVKQPSRDLGLEGSPFYLNTETRPWVRAHDVPRRASVSALGFGGTNFHVALEEYRGEGARPLRVRSNPAELMLLHGESAAAVAAACRREAAALTPGGSSAGASAGTSVDGARAAFLHAAKRSQKAFDATAPARLAIVASSAGELGDKLLEAAQLLEKSASAFSTPRGIHFGVGRAAGPVAVLFPGQGSQYVGMGRDLAVHFEAARAIWDEVADLGLHDVAFPPPAWGEDAKRAQETRLTATEWAQPAIAATSLSMLALLEQLGLTPTCAGGHSLGEVTALGAYGALAREATVRVARKRGELVAAAAAQGDGAMLAVVAELSKVRAWLAAWKLDVVVANHNAPQQVVLSGARAAVDEAARRLAAEGVDARPLPVSAAFHSPMVAAASAPFRAFLETVPAGQAKVPLYANRTGALHTSDANAVRGEAARAVAEPVMFVDQIEAMYAAGARVFVEVGPGSVLTKLVGRCLEGRPHLAIETDARGKDGVASFVNALARLSAGGVPLAFDALWQGDNLPPDPSTLTKSKLTLQLTGANYGKPLQVDNPPPQAATAQKSVQKTVKAAPSSPVASATAQVPPSPGVARTHVQATAMQVTPATPMQATSRQVTSTPMQATSTHPTPVQTPTTTRAAAPIGASAPAASLPLTGGVPASLIALQMEYQRLMSESHLAFLRMVPSLYRGDSHVGQVVNMPMTPAVSPVPAAYVQPAPSLASVPVAVAAPVAAVPAAVAAPVAAVPAAVAAPVAAAPAVDLVKLMLDVVSEKTGYPQEMIELTMDLEADLGIDSIKRVEILSAVRKKAPNLPQVDTARMGRMRTLREIIEFFGAEATVPAAGAEIAKPSATTVAPQAAAPAMTSGTTSGTTQGPAIDLVKLMLEVVAEKTGYPAEMIELTMDLESDLGIDSIKRVEILSAVRKKAPSLPQVDTARMGRMRTLREIVDFFGSGAAPAPSAHTASAATPLAAAPAPAASVDLVKLMLEVVAEKTGYPAEMIELTMDLESDLGIDSIKRVEILSAVRKKAPNLPQVDTARMGRMRTLREIVDFFGGGAPAASPSAVAASPSAAARANIPASNGAASKVKTSSRLATRALPAEPPGLALAGLFAGDVVLTQDGTGVADALATKLAAQGITARVVAEVPAHAKAVIFLGGLRAAETVDDAVAVNREGFLAARAVAERFREGGGAFVTVQDTGGDFGLGGRANTRAWLAGLGALAKTAAEEWPTASVRALDIERGGRTADAIAEALAEELLSGGIAREVGLRADGTRCEVVGAQAAALAPGRDIPHGAVFVVSGGARGVTAASLVELARACKPRLLLVGRSPLVDEPASFRGCVEDAQLKRAALAEASQRGTPATPKEVSRRVNEIVSNREVRETLRALEAAGAEVRYAAVDVRDAAALGALLTDVRKVWGPIQGLVHGAGVLSDALIDRKTDAQFDAVWNTKVGGLRALLEATQQDPLGWICLFSSVAARFGNAGQVDYAMANEVLNKVASSEAQRRGEGCRVVSIGWGPWEGGMVTPALRAHFESRGVELLGIEAGALAFVRELTGQGDVEICIGGGQHVELPSQPRRVEATVVVTERRWPQLASHRIQGKVVLPMAVALELFSRLAQAQLGVRDAEAPLYFRDLRVVRGVALEGYGTAKADVLTLVAQPEEGGSAMRFELRDARGALRYSATLDSSAPPPPSTPNRNASLVSSPWHTTSDFYGPKTLFHGPHFQVLRSVDGISADHARAAIASTRAAGWSGEWFAEPAGFDGAIQLALLFALHGGLGPTLPMRVGSVVVRHAADSAGALQCELTKRVLTDDTMSCDLSLTTAAGVRILEVQDLEIFKVPSGSTAADALAIEA